MPESSSPLAKRAGGPLILLAALTLASGGLALEAMASERSWTGEPPPRADSAAPATAQVRTVSREVWIGRDADGDGQPDFANPTGRDMRGCDDYGCGSFGAERDAGGRRHEGADFDAVRGQAVQAPMSGYVTRIGEAYADDGRFKFVEITNPALRFVARVFYIQPNVREGQTVRIGQTIGRARSLQARYPGITDHVHLEISRVGRPKIDPSLLITAKLESVPETAG